MKPPVITIFGSGILDENYLEYQRAVLMGRLLAQEGFVICNGGYGGIMEASARGAKEAGGKTLGITTNEFRGRANRWIDQEEKMDTWRQRLFRLIDAAHAYVIFDGGTGTLAELFVVWEMTNRNLLKTPIVLFGRFFRLLLKHLRRSPALIFNERLKIAETPQAAVDFLKKNL